MTARARLRRAMPDSIDTYFGLIPALAYCAAFMTWASVIVRAIRGGDVEPGWRVYVSTGAAMATYTVASATRVRETATLRAAAVEMHAVVREAAQDAKAREAAAAEQQDRLTRLTKWLVALAALTLLAAVVTLVVAVVGS